MLYPESAGARAKCTGCLHHERRTNTSRCAFVGRPMAASQMFLPRPCNEGLRVMSPPLGLALRGQVELLSKACDTCGNSRPTVGHMRACHYDCGRSGPDINTVPSGARPDDCPGWKRKWTS